MQYPPFCVLFLCTLSTVLSVFVCSVDHFVCFSVHSANRFVCFCVHCQPSGMFLCALSTILSVFVCILPTVLSVLCAPSTVFSFFLCSVNRFICFDVHCQPFCLFLRTLSTILSVFVCTLSTVLSSFFCVHSVNPFVCFFVFPLSTFFDCFLCAMLRPPFRLSLCNTYYDINGVVYFCVHCPRFCLTIFCVAGHVPNRFLKASRLTERAPSPHLKNKHFTSPKFTRWTRQTNPMA